MQSFFIVAVASLIAVASAQCPSGLSPSYPAPSMASGWQSTLIANNLSSPRSLLFDPSGHLLVLQQGDGIVSLTLEGEAPCLRVSESKTIVSDEDLNHGLELSQDGRTLYASTSYAVYSWDYDVEQQATTSENRTLILIGGTHHTTRTLLLSRTVPGMLLVSWGSQDNVDPTATNENTGVSQVRAFNLTEIGDKPISFSNSGIVMGWGLRNSVGVGEHPITGGIFTNENSVDEMEREGQDVHENNPGEELNFHGYLNGTEYENQGRNYGYPFCFATWNRDELPMNENLQIGTQFAIGDQNSTVNDTYCANDVVPPVLTFAAHMAPIDLAFTSDGSACFITFRGSWNRDQPQGYKLSVIPFNNSTGMPTAAPDSSSSEQDIMVNADTSRCPRECFRPAGLAWDSNGRLFMSSDATNEIYLVSRADNAPADDTVPSSTTPPSPSGTGDPATSSTTGAATGLSMTKSSSALAALLLVLAFFI